MTTSLSWLPLIACIGIIAWSLRRWERRARVQFGPCMPGPQVSSRRRWHLVRSRKALPPLPRRRLPGRPVDGEPLDDGEQLLFEIAWHSWDLNPPAPEPSYPNLTRDWLEDL